MSDNQFKASSSQSIDDQETQDGQKQQDNNIDQKIERSEDQVASAQAPTIEENVDYKDKWLRAQADYSNLVKETNARRAGWVAYSEAQILEEFLPVYDNFCKAFAHEIKNGEKDFESWKKGIEYIMQQFWTVLKNHNIEKIETNGKQFDPNMHEAVGQEGVEGKQEGEIIREVDPGYSMRGKVIKVAKVIVNSK